MTVFRSIPRLLLSYETFVGHPARNQKIGEREKGITSHLAPQVVLLEDLMTFSCGVLFLRLAAAHTCVHLA